MRLVVNNTTPEDAERALDAAPPVRYRETESAVAAAARVQRTYSAQADVMGTGPHCTGNCNQGRAQCVNPAACGVQYPVAQLAPAEELQAEPRRSMTPQTAADLAGTIVGFTLVLLAVIAGASWLTTDSASAFFTWAGKTLAALF